MYTSYPSRRALRHAARWSGTHRLLRREVGSSPDDSGRPRDRLAGARVGRTRAAKTKPGGWWHWYGSDSLLRRIVGLPGQNPILEVGWDGNLAQKSAPTVSRIRRVELPAYCCSTLRERAGTNR